MPRHGCDCDGQYLDSSNLDARRALHERFSTSREHWHTWIFRHFEAPPEAVILEVGCGSGELWRNNSASIPAGWRITLSDQSRGMLESTGKRLAGLTERFSFLQADACNLPFPDASFDCVVANHMLYHAGDVDAAVAEISRVLKLSGRLYAATNGEEHLRELRTLVRAVAPEMPYGHESPDKPFSLENGAATLRRHFEHVSLEIFEGDLEITDAEAVVRYVLSVTDAARYFDKGRAPDLKRLVQERIDEKGAFHVSRSTGMFLAYVPRQVT